ncbi:hypothetical protein [Streptomyces sp. NBC_00328]|uniref:hypothetical protein n=1 Tax=Streptomyces sp. NBC_00328 TaxID=2903646 RepID=UPI002E2D2AFA|nr:hypothetical protein [Streptomyces sp. NBC_00328]
MTTAMRVGAVVRQLLTRTALSHRICTGISRKHLGKLIAELTVAGAGTDADFDRVPVLVNHHVDLCRSGQVDTEGGAHPAPLASTDAGQP